MMKNIEKYVELTGELINLPLQSEHFSGVVANMERIAAIAQLVIDFPLPPEIEPAPKFDLEKWGEKIEK
ncbi:DUF4089 domain-containing protein [Dapis sp. BLCC M172]|uniref:DUF4089 domain-containing protein n=1 Tax=Dapis sp. BLCC M172 TaxID=2975281 RepID=UPI003CEBDD65